MSEMAELRRRVDLLSDREEIRDVLYAYTRGVDRADSATVKACYHADADDIHWGTFVGNAHEFADYLMAPIRKITSLIHEITNPLIDLDGERAFVESRYTCRVRIDLVGAPSDTWVEHVSHGRYLDVFERRGGPWKIAHRRLVKEGARVLLITDQLVPWPKPEAAPHAWPDDLVYAGFGVIDVAPEPFTPPPNHDHFDQVRDFGYQAMALRNEGT
jgi:hypothetical protein